MANTAPPPTLSVQIYFKLAYTNTKNDALQAMQLIFIIPMLETMRHNNRASAQHGTGKVQKLPRSVKSFSPSLSILVAETSVHATCARIRTHFVPYIRTSVHILFKNALPKIAHSELRTHSHTGRRTNKRTHRHAHTHTEEFIFSVRPNSFYVHPHTQAHIHTLPLKFLK